MLHIDPIRRAEDLNAAPANSTVVGAFPVVNHVLSLVGLPNEVSGLS
jgi:hypothetical protein